MNQLNGVLLVLKIYPQFGFFICGKSLIEKHPFVLVLEVFQECEAQL